MRMLLALLLAVGPAHAGSTVQRDAPTVRYYTPDGKPAGSATTYGNTTRYYTPDGKPAGSATAYDGTTKLYTPDGKPAGTLRKP